MLYIFFIYIDFFHKSSFISVDRMKYLSIILCFLMVLLIGKDALNKRDKAFLQAGFFMTIIVDLCLIILDYFILGVVFFCFVQIIYTIRYEFKKIKYILMKFAIIFHGIMIAYWMIDFFIIKIDILFAVVLFYAICLITSVMRGIKACKNNVYPYLNRYMISFGMIFFLLCDINVGLYNISAYIDLSVNFENTSYLLIWLFYLPSQVLIALSGYDFHRNKNY